MPAFLLQSLRWTTHIIIAMLSLFGIMLLYVVYIYGPPEARAETPKYLTEMQAAGHDHFVEAGRFRLHYIELGQGDPVVLLPGGGAWAYDMRDLAQRLARGHTVYVVDSPGDGYTTSILPDPDYHQIYNLEVINDSLLEFMNRLGLAKAAFAGSSWGGGYGLYFAETHRNESRSMCLWMEPVSTLTILAETCCGSWRNCRCSREFTARQVLQAYVH